MPAKSVYKGTSFREFITFHLFVQNKLIIFLSQIAPSKSSASGSAAGMRIHAEF